MDDAEVNKLTAELFQLEKERERTRLIRDNLNEDLVRCDRRISKVLRKLNDLTYKDEGWDGIK